ncbi:transposase ISSoEn3, IS21 family [Candidatus Sodalis pierantonius str. SOPE]|uniref:Transposase ISSoEn3, IS21 family n=1 Tax=Candidatus Sodalis pierantonii str. SOPE TaxID=2342 RepID=W0HNC4_9GAMM|nr:IS21-like element ISSoEn3 family transposase [Candidatus Sodalis pierantonius]AHF73603.1 transposase ISSoEn3, IS21 family [Candidatus Sodalis pierantonius str. SOPE]
MARKKKKVRTEMCIYINVLRMKFEQRRSNRTIAAALGIGCTTVHDILGRFTVANLVWPLPAELSPVDLDRLLYPGKSGKVINTLPSWLDIDTELSRKGMTKQLLWIEYQSAVGGDAIGYSQFCALFRDWKKKQRRSMRMEHKAGEKLFIDFCGPTVPIVNPATGSVRQVAIFVAAMGVSGYAYIEACEGQDMASWLNANSRCLHFMGGVPELMIPDNLRSAVSTPDRYEPVINQSYQALANHYETVVLPARPRKPKDKAKAESTVQLVERWVLARLRKRRFYSLAELNQVIRELNHELNLRPMRHYGGQSRLERFEQLDKPALGPLPPTQWEYSEYLVARVGPDYHIDYGKNWYSVPHPLVGERVDVIATQRLVQIHHKGVCVATHPRSDNAYRHTTQAAHMPANHKGQSQWTPERLCSWALSVGVCTLKVVESIQKSKAHPEQAYRSVLGLLNLQRRYETTRLEKACALALEKGCINRSFIANVLKHGRESEVTQDGPGVSMLVHENLRGPDSYH